MSWYESTVQFIGMNGRSGLYLRSFVLVNWLGRINTQRGTSWQCFFFRAATRLDWARLTPLDKLCKSI